MLQDYTENSQLFTHLLHIGHLLSFGAQNQEGYNAGEQNTDPLFGKAQPLTT